MLDWLYLWIERKARANPARLDRLCRHIPLWYVRRLRRAKLVSTLRNVYRHSPVQRQRWQEAGIRLGDIRSPKVLERIPFTTGSKLAEHPENYFCVPREEFIHILTTSSTGGLQKKIFLTADDFYRQVRMIATHLRRFPGTSRVAVMFSVADPTWTAGAVVRRGIEEAGMLGFLSGVHRSPQDQIKLIKEYQINCLLSIPSYVGRITLEAKEDLRKLGVRYIHLGAQPWSEELRRTLEEAWGAKVIDGYGSNEFVCGIAGECFCQNNLHLAEADYWIEIVDPATGKALPEGQDGEVVITTLSRRGMPLVRYKTGDLAHLMPSSERCECGLPLGKMSRVRGRVDDMLIIGAGENLYPDEIDRSVLSIPGVSDYQLIVEQQNFKDVLHLRLEANDSADHLKTKALTALMAIDAIKVSCEATQSLTIGQIEVLPPGALSRGQIKSVRIVDRRKEERSRKVPVGTG